MSVDDNIMAPRHPPVGQMSVKRAFDSPDDSQKLYAHHMARYACRSVVLSLAGLRCRLELPGTVLESSYARSLKNQHQYLISSWNYTQLVMVTGIA